MKLYLKSLSHKTHIIWLTFKDWLQGRASTTLLLKMLKAKVFVAENTQVAQVGVQLSEAKIRQMLRGTRDFIVRADPDGRVTAFCKKCATNMTLAIKDSYLWFYCAQCQRLSFNPLVNVQRDVRFAEKDQRPFRYELFFAPKLPASLIPPFQTIYPTHTEDLAPLLHVTDQQFIFKEHALALAFPNSHWQLQPQAYRKNPRKELFTFTRLQPWQSAAGPRYTPTVMLSFFPVPPATPLAQLPVIARTLGLPEVAVEYTFGAKNSSVPLQLAALGQYGHFASPSFPGQPYSIYFVFGLCNTTGFVLLLEIIDDVLAQAQPEFYHIMQSLKLLK